MNVAVKTKLEPGVVIPVILGFMFAFGDEASNPNGTLTKNVAALCLKIVLYCATFVVLFRFLDTLCNRKIGSTSGETSDINKHHILSYEYSVKAWLLCAFTIAISWLPYEIWLFPGVYWSDTSKQLLMYYGAVELTDHHPFILTYVFGWFADFGQLLFGNPIYGLYLLIIIQLIAAPLLFSWMVLYTKKIGLPYHACSIELAFFALFPLFPVMFSSLAKDTISVLFFIPYTILYIDVFRTKGESTSKTRTFVLILLCGLLTCMTKKAGVYIVVPSLLLMVIAKISIKAKALLVSAGLIIAIVMAIVLPHLIMPVLHVAPGGKQESIPFAIQQVAHDVKYNGNNIAPSEKELISDFLTIKYSDIPKAYNSQSVDPVKGTSLRNPELFGDFIKLWLKKTVEHPVGHFEAWIGLVRGWFSFQNIDGSPNNMVVCTESAWYYDPIRTYIPQWPVEESHSALARSMYNTEQSIPVFNVLFSRSVWASIIPFYMLYLAIRRGKGKLQRLLAVLPLGLTFLYLLLVPVSGYGGEPTRYVLQAICISPLLLAYLSVGCGNGENAMIQAAETSVK